MLIRPEAAPLAVFQPITGATRALPDFARSWPKFVTGRGATEPVSPSGRFHVQPPWARTRGREAACVHGGNFAGFGDFRTTRSSCSNRKPYPGCCRTEHPEDREAPLRRRPDRLTRGGSWPVFTPETLLVVTEKGQRNQSGRSLRQGQRINRCQRFRPSRRTCRWPPRPGFPGCAVPLPCRA